MNDKIFGHEWADIQRAQQGGRLHQTIKFATGDYGADPIGNGTFRMVPSGDVVDYDERCRRLARTGNPARAALTRAVNSAIADGSPVYVNISAKSET